MKKALFIFLALVAFKCTAQNKKQIKDTIKSAAYPNYQVDPQRIYEIHLKVRFDQAQIFVMPDELLAHNPQMTGDKIGAWQDWKKEQIKSIVSQVNNQLESDYRQWQTDSIKQVKKHNKNFKK